MAYIVADPCVNCKYTDCVDVCPVTCFYEGLNMLVIHPDECIDCGACEPECPTTAIFEEDDLPEKWAVYTPLNAVFSGAEEPEDVEMDAWPKHLVDAVNSDGFEPWPCIDEKTEAMEGADDVAEEENKLSAFSPDPPEE